jgi:hypothetical protein
MINGVPVIPISTACALVWTITLALALWLLPAFGGIGEVVPFATAQALSRRGVTLVSGLIRSGLHRWLTGWGYHGKRSH